MEGVGSEDEVAVDEGRQGVRVLKTANRWEVGRSLKEIWRNCEARSKWDRRRHEEASKDVRGRFEGNLVEF